MNAIHSLTLNISKTANLTVRDYRALVLLSIFTAAFLSQCVAILSLYKFGKGVWPQSELSISALFFTSFILSVLFLIMILFDKKDRARLTGIILQPLVLSVALYAFWSCLSSFFHAVALRGFFGAPEQGEGASWQLSFFILMVAYLYLRLFSYYRRIFFYWLIFVTLAMAIVALGFNKYWHFAPFFYHDYLAFLAAYAAIFVLAWGQGFVKIRTFISAMLFIFVLYVSENMTAILAATALLPMVYVGYCIPVVKKFWHVYGVFLLVFVPIVFFSFVLVLGGVNKEDLAVLKAYSFTSSYHDIVVGPFLSLKSRFEMIPIALHSLLESPITFIFGKGWGSFSDQLVAYLPVDRLDLIDGKGPRWEGTKFAHFHSHNMFCEALLAGGAVSLLLFWNILITAFRYAKRCISHHILAFLLVFTGIASFWFQMVVTVPMMAIAFASIVKPCVRKRWHRYCLPYVVIFIAVVVVVQGAASYAAFDTALRTHRYEIPTFEGSCELDFADYGRGGLHLTQMVRNYSGQLLEEIPEIQEIYDKKGVLSEFVTRNNANDFSVDLQDFARLEYLMCQVDYYMEQYVPGYRLELASLLVVSDIALSFEKYLPEGKADKLLQGWNKKIEHFIERVPRRTDVAIPYMIWQYDKGNTDAVRDMALFVLKHNDKEPAGLWFNGLVLLNTEDRALEGLRYMREALDNNLEYRLPVDKDLKQQVLDNT